MPRRQESSAPIGDGIFGVSIDTVDVMRQGNRESLISFYAAGIGVMFLLFSITGASGSLLDEVDSGTLDRVLSTRVGMSGLLAGKWMFLTLMGAAQLTLMFLWGRIAFGLDLFHHVPGFVVMTAFTAAAAAGFGLVLATAARTRAQLSGMSTIIILIMSSMGGSMFPRFLMSETMQKIGLVTFNAWALDGYLKVFWRNAPLVALWPQLLVLAGLTLAFLAIARTFARRWEPEDLYFVVGEVDTESFGHPVERAAVDAEHLRGAGAVAADLLDARGAGSGARSRRATADRRTAVRAGRARPPRVNGRSAMSIDRAAAEDDEPLDRVLQLANVARPVDTQVSAATASGVKSTRRPARLQALLRETSRSGAGCLRGDRGAPAPWIDDHAEAIEEILPEPLLRRPRARDRTLVAATTRTSTLTMRLAPTGRTSPSCSTRSSLTCSAGEVSPISSRNTVPPLRLFEDALRIGDRAGERAARVAEQLRLEHAFR